MAEFVGHADDASKMLSTGRYGIVRSKDILSESKSADGVISGSSREASSSAGLVGGAHKSTL